MKLSNRQVLNVVLVLLAIGIALFGLWSCSTGPTTKEGTTEDIKMSLETRGMHSFGSRFTSDDKFLVLKINGEYETNLPNTPGNGTWTLESDGQILRLSSLTENEGKGRVYVVNYTVLEMNDDTIILVNLQGDKI